MQKASVAVVGAGGLGCPALQYLAAVGIGWLFSSSDLRVDNNLYTLGKLVIIDHDIVEVSNLQRQILHTQDSVGLPKVISAAQALKK